MKTLIITRFSADENHSLGSFMVLNNKQEPLFAALSLERGWRNNEPMISSIPEGAYPIVKEYSDHFKKELWEIKGVPNRSECKFHSANYWRELNGCIALGSATADIDEDGYLDITNSVETMERFQAAMGPDTHAILIIKYKD